MKNALTAILCASVMVTALTAVYAKPKGGGMGPGSSEERKAEFREKAAKFHEKRMEKLTEVLGLSPEQKNKISNILKDGWEKIRIEREKMRERAKTMREETDRLIEKELTPEQVKKFKEYREKMKKKIEKKMGGRWHRKQKCMMDPSESDE